MIEWKPIPNYENLYEVSNTGEIRSIKPRYKNKQILKAGVGSRGYLVVTLCNKNTQKSYNVHRLVAQAFIPNPNNLPCVNHKDENRTNNNVDNLEWCTYKYNNTYGNRLDKYISKRGKSVMCVETNKVYRSTQEASKLTGINQGGISSCCNGKRNVAGGFHWVFV